MISKISWSFTHNIHIWIAQYSADLVDPKTDPKDRSDSKDRTDLYDRKDALNRTDTKDINDL